VYQHFSSNITVTYPAMNEYTYFPCGTLTPFQSMASPEGASWSHALDTPHSIGTPWMIAQPNAETSTWNHATLTRDKHLCPGGIRTHNLSKRATTDPCLITSVHWCRRMKAYCQRLTLIFLVKNISNATESLITEGFFGQLISQNMGTVSATARSIYIAFR
jgi:hypothetical protein